MSCGCSVHGVRYEVRGAPCEMRRVTVSEIHRVHTRAKAPGVDLSTPLAPGKIYSSVGGLPAIAAGRDKSLSPQLRAIGAAPSKTAAPTQEALNPKFTRAACPLPPSLDTRVPADVQSPHGVDLLTLVRSVTNKVVSHHRADRDCAESGGRAPIQDEHVFHVSP